MKKLKQLEESGIELKVLSEEDVNIELLRKQIDMNGSLNDYNIDVFPNIFFQTGLKNLFAIVKRYPWSREVYLLVGNVENTYILLCDFPLAERTEDLIIERQLENMLEHISRKYLCELSIYTGPIDFFIYQIENLNLVTNPKSSCLEVKIGRVNEGRHLPVTFWDNKIGQQIKKRPIKFPRLYIDLLAYKQSLNRAFKELTPIENFDEYVPCFIDISNMMCMIYEGYERKFSETDSRVSTKIPRVEIEVIEELIFLNYTNIERLIKDDNPIYYLNL